MLSYLHSEAIFLASVGCMDWKRTRLEGMLEKYDEFSIGHVECEVEMSSRQG